MELAVNKALIISSLSILLIRQIRAGEESCDLRLQTIEKMVFDVYEHLIPTKANPPYDRCPSGWSQHERSCFWFSSEEKNWFAAAQICQTKNSWLVEIGHISEALFLIRRIDDLGQSTRYWTGANDLAEEAIFTWWQSAKKVTYPDFEAGQPDNYLDSEHCAEFRKKHNETSWGLNDIPCTTELRFICEKAF